MDDNSHPRWQVQPEPLVEPPLAVQHTLVQGREGLEEGARKVGLVAAAARALYHCQSATRKHV